LRKHIEEKLKNAQRKLKEGKFDYIYNNSLQNNGKSCRDYKYKINEAKEVLKPAIIQLYNDLNAGKKQ